MPRESFPVSGACGGTAGEPRGPHPFDEVDAELEAEYNRRRPAPGYLRRLLMLWEGQDRLENEDKDVERK